MANYSLVRLYSIYHVSNQELWMYPFQTFILPYFYHKKSTEEEKLEKIETAVTKLQGNMVDTGKFCQQLLFLLVVLVYLLACRLRNLFCFQCNTISNTEIALILDKEGFSYKIKLKAWKLIKYLFCSIFFTTAELCKLWVVVIQHFISKSKCFICPSSIDNNCCAKYKGRLIKTWLTFSFFNSILVQKSLDSVKVIDTRQKKW